MMQNSQISIKQRFSEEPLLRLALFLGVFTSFIALALYGYLGTFSRYGSDDYCLSAFFVQPDVFNAFIQRYFSASSRYTNILFIGLVDRLFGWYNVAILPALMLILFVVGFYLLLKEIVEMLKLGWCRWVIFLLSLLVVFFSITQSPDLYETLYWRAGMTSHLAPLVFIPFFGVFLLRHIRKANEGFFSLWAQAAAFLIPVVIGGFSEPPTALMITVLGLAIVAVWWWGDTRSRRSVLMILICSLLGALTALSVMAIAPANSIRMQTPPPPLPELVSKTIAYPSFFIVDTLRTLPTPTLVSVAVAALLFYATYALPSQPLSREARNRLIILMLLVLVFTYLLIAASFAPSVYGQSYPVPRSRFAARVLMTSALMMEGAVVGILVAQGRTTSFPSVYLRNFVIVAFMIFSLYPLRIAWRTFGEIPAYQQRAAAWDLRDAEIRRLKAEGTQDVVVGFLSDEETQDLGDYREYRLNRCAATLYGVKTIMVVPVK
jgi:hypothetical protein